MKRIKILEVCGATGWEIWEVSKEEMLPIESRLLNRTGGYGVTEYDKQRIYIRSGLPAAMKFDTILHELQHAWLAVSGLAHWMEEATPSIADFEEKFIRVNTPAMIATLRSAGFLSDGDK